jgi:hypothetical protein
MSAVLKHVPRISMVAHGAFDVAALVSAVNKHPELWDQNTLRTKGYGPHAKVSDIWVRYNALENLKSDDRQAFNSPHESVWYPAASVLPVKPLVMQLMALVGGTRLGGVLITKIPAHEQCLPHVDRGWHAEYYEKFAIQLAANSRQAFHFEGESLVTQPGDLFTFDNSYTHWVTNDSDEDRMTLICCIRRL